MVHRTPCAVQWEELPSFTGSVFLWMIALGRHSVAEGAATARVPQRRSERPALSRGTDSADWQERTRCCARWRAMHMLARASVPSTMPRPKRFGVRLVEQNPRTGRPRPIRESTLRTARALTARSDCIAVRAAAGGLGRSQPHGTATVSSSKVQSFVSPTSFAKTARAVEALRIARQHKPEPRHAVAGKRFLGGVGPRVLGRESRITSRTTH